MISLKKKKLISLFIILSGFIVLLFLLTPEPKIDSTSLESYSKSYSKLYTSLSPKNKKKFKSAVSVLFYEYGILPGMEYMHNETYTSILDKAQEILQEKEIKINKIITLKNNIEITAYKINEYNYRMEFENLNEIPVFQFSFIVTLQDESGRIFKEEGETEEPIGKLMPQEVFTDSLNFLQYLSTQEHYQIEQIKEGMLTIKITLVSAYELEEDIISPSDLEFYTEAIELLLE